MASTVVCCVMFKTSPSGDNSGIMVTDRALPDGIKKWITTVINAIPMDAVPVPKLESGADRALTIVSMIFPFSRST